MGDKRDLIVVPVARVSERVAQCWKKTLEKSAQEKISQKNSLWFQRRIRKHERLEDV